MMDRTATRRSISPSGLEIACPMMMSFRCFGRANATLSNPPGGSDGHAFDSAHHAKTGRRRHMRIFAGLFV
ncbi:hypothetical protein [Agrobacterium sp.]|uniref:hypothetical protein n=1 Tax=Agrobacterium sp. TaxID=361 RepID=UPI004037865C